MPQPSASRPSLRLERRFLSQGHRLIAGIDEAGRGAWAGPVVAGAVILPLDDRRLRVALRGVCDSKLLTPRERERLYERILATALAVGVGGAGPGEVDRDGLMAATRAAMQRAVTLLSPQPEALLLDAVDLRAEVDLPQRWLPHGEAASLSIAAASIVAKVSRDRLMVALDARYPGYSLAQHKGYGTALHQAALARLGPSEIHRASFAPVAGLAML